MTRLPRGILFDMDGTLTTPMLDFPRIKADMGIPPDAAILEALAGMPDQQRAQAEAELLRHEEQAARDSTLNAGCTELLCWLDERELRVAVVTRNSLLSARTVFERHRLKIDTLITRDDGVFKPSPAPLHLACDRLQLKPADVWMAGDGRYDIEAGNAAGIATVWISHRKRRTFDAMPWRVVRDLIELREMLAALRGEGILPSRPPPGGS
jgi:HAD superfamily hydrolase (TIGR01509 family)